MKKTCNISLRKCGNRYLLVSVEGKALNFADVYSMNATAAFIWQHLDDTTDARALADALVAEYDVDRDTARADIEAQLGQWKSMGLIE